MKVTEKDRLNKLKRRMIIDNAENNTTPAQNFISIEVLDYAIKCIEIAEQPVCGTK